MESIELTIGDQSYPEVNRLEVEEGVSRLFDLHIVLHSPDPALDLEPLVGLDAKVALTAELPAGRRLWRGIVARAEQTHAVEGGAGEELSEYRLHVVPAMWLATQRVEHRIFQHRTIPEIVEEVLSRYGDIEMKVDRAAHPRLEYRVQYDESDFAFASRLLEETGISYAFLEQDDASVMVCGDGLTASPLRSHATLPFDGTDAVEMRLPRIRRVSLVANHRPARHTVTDYDFRNPAWRFHASADGERRRPGEQEVHRYAPGRSVIELESGPTVTPQADDKGFARADRAFADERSKRLVQAGRSGRLQLELESNQIELSAGSVLGVEQHPHPMLAAPILITRTSILVEAPSTLRVGHAAVSAGEPFRTPLETPRPRVTGMQSARVTGPTNEEIHVDEHGRIRIHFPWDRDGETDERSTCWLRVAQGWAGVGYGAIALPRVGQEVLVAFLEGDPDHPVVVGRMYNELNPVPYKLPDNKTVSAMRTSSSPANGGFNELKIEDKAHREFIYVRAQRDRHELVLRDQRTRIERKHHRTTVDDEHAVVKQTRRELVLGQSHLHVVGDRRERYDANRAATVGTDWDVKVGNKWAVESGREIHLAAGATLVIEAGARLTLKGPGGFIDIHEGGVDVVGDMVRINSGGAAGLGSGAAPIAPDDAEEAEPMDTSLD